MKNTGRSWRTGVYPLCLILFLNGCTEKKAMPSVHVVEIKQMKFTPEALDVKKGDTVVWVNHDIVAHDVTEETNKAWSSSSLAPGKSWRMVVTSNANYYCAIHRVMKGKLLLK